MALFYCSRDMIYPLSEMVEGDPDFRRARLYLRIGGADTRFLRFDSIISRERARASVNPVKHIGLRSDIRFGADGSCCALAGAILRRGIGDDRRGAAL
jgi:hypothetical protein